MPITREKHVKKVIHFKGNQYLFDNSMEYFANAINALFDQVPEDYSTDLRLRKIVVLDIMVFIKAKYFQKEGMFSIFDDGDFRVDLFYDVTFTLEEAKVVCVNLD